MVARFELSLAASTESCALSIPAAEVAPPPSEEEDTLREFEDFNDKDWA